LQYQLLTTELFKMPPTKRPTGKRSREGSPIQSSDDRTYSLRSDLFDKLSSHFPEGMTHPRGNLIDLIPFSSVTTENILSK
jgi:hypothetical protein